MSPKHAKKVEIWAKMKTHWKFRRKEIYFWSKRFLLVIYFSYKELFIIGFQSTYLCTETRFAPPLAEHIWKSKWYTTKLPCVIDRILVQMHVRRGCWSALNDCSLEKISRFRRKKVRHHTHRAGTFAKYCDLRNWNKLLQNKYFQYAKCKKCFVNVMFKKLVKA
jgi:hypothetical protein